MIVSDVFSKMFYIFGSRISSAKAESQSSGNGHHSHESGKQSLSESSGDSQLIQGGQNGESPDRPLGQSSQQMSGRSAGRFGRTHHYSLHGVGDESGHHQDQSGDDDIGQIAENDIFQEIVHLVKAQDVQRSDQENYHQKPLDQPADKVAGIESEASFMEHLVNADGLKNLVHFQRTYYLINKFADY